MSLAWRPLGAVEPSDLSSARMQLHYATQVVSGVGRTLRPKQDDDSHTNLGWNRRLGALVGRRVECEEPFSAGLEVAALRLLLLDDKEQVLTSASLEGLTVDEAYEWLGEGVAARRGEPLADGFTPLHYELPDHALAAGARFEIPEDSPFSELARWFHNAELLLTSYAERYDGASEVRCWPHHFDIATLIDFGSGKKIGFGMSPGDDYYDQPYFYCSPYPQPGPEDLLTLGNPGRWHTDGFFSIVMRGEDLLGFRDREATVSAYAEGAMITNKRMLEV